MVASNQTCISVQWSQFNVTILHKNFTSLSAIMSSNKRRPWNSQALPLPTNTLPLLLDKMQHNSPAFM
jgi:hypothetical protein